MCVEQFDGSSLALNYAYLVSIGYPPNDSQISLGFTTYKATVKGINLSSVFNRLNSHPARVLTAVDARYVTAASDAEVVIVEIKVLEI